MKVLGIDPGLALLGWSVLEMVDSSHPYVKFGCLKTSSTSPLTLRLNQIYAGLEAIIDNEKPDVLSLETLFFVKNAKTLAQVGHARGVILLVAGQKKLAVFEYAPRQIKMALTGYGGADKRQMQLMAQRMLGLKKIPHPDDAADAIAVALCHHQYSQSMGKSAVTV